MSLHPQAGQLLLVVAELHSSQMLAPAQPLLAVGAVQVMPVLVVKGVDTLVYLTVQRHKQPPY
jgi:hypothetical protein